MLDQKVTQVDWLVPGDSEREAQSFSAVGHPGNWMISAGSHLS